MGKMPSVRGGEQGEEEVNMDGLEEAVREEFLKRKREEQEDQRFKTVHFSNLPDDTTEENLHVLAKNFGEVHRLPIERSDTIGVYGLVEFAERGPAHVCKQRGKFLVDGRLVLATESKVFVDEELVQEKDVVFQNAVLDGINMRETLATQDDIREKVKKVRAVAEKIVARKEKGEGAVSSSSSSSSDSSSDSSADKVKKAA